MEKYILKAQTGASTDFWGLNKGQYTPEYKNAVNAIVSNDVLFNKITKLNPITKDSFVNLAFDSKVGEIHNSIRKIQESTTSLPKHLIKYSTQRLGTQTVPAKQFIDIHKTDFDNELMRNNNDSTTAFYSLVNKLETPRKVGSYNDLNSVKNPLLNENNKSSFLTKKQRGDSINYDITDILKQFVN